MMTEFHNLGETMVSWSIPFSILEVCVYYNEKMDDYLVVDIGFLCFVSTVSCEYIPLIKKVLPIVRNTRKREKRYAVMTIRYFSTSDSVPCQCD